MLQRALGGGGRFLGELLENSFARFERPRPERDQTPQSVEQVTLADPQLFSSTLASDGRQSFEDFGVLTWGELHFREKRLRSGSNALGSHTPGPAEVPDSRPVSCPTACRRRTVR